MKTLCGKIPNEADCSYCLDSYECNLLQKKETAEKKGSEKTP